MKKHAIIPIFIPHKGCPHQCVFCNQKTITARNPKSLDELVLETKETVERYLPTLKNRGLTCVELAFFGGSFTAIPRKDQRALLAVAKEYKEAGKIQKIHLSTRPDAINREVLDQLREFDADVIELGVQSFAFDVLEDSKRGHTKEDVEQACRLIHEYGFTLGIQLMIGLPKDTREKDIESAKQAVLLHPDNARIYPTVVLEDTELAEMMARGDYTPVPQEEAAETAAEMMEILENAGITILRVGLKSTDLIHEESDLTHNYHPAFRELAEGKMARKKLDRMLTQITEAAKREGHPLTGVFTIYASPRDLPAAVGHKAVNRTALEQQYAPARFSWRKDEALQHHEYVIEYDAEDFSFTASTGISERD